MSYCYAVDRCNNIEGELFVQFRNSSGTYCSSSSFFSPLLLFNNTTKAKTTRTHSGVKAKNFVNVAKWRVRS